MILGKDNIERLPPVGTSDWVTFHATRIAKIGLAYCKGKVEICRQGFNS